MEFFFGICFDIHNAYKKVLTILGLLKTLASGNFYTNQTYWWIRGKAVNRQQQESKIFVIIVSPTNPGKHGQ